MAPHLTTFPPNTFYSNKRTKLNGGNSASITNNNSRDNRFLNHTPVRKRNYNDKYSFNYHLNSTYYGNSRKSSPFNNRSSPKKRNGESRPISSLSNFNSKKSKI